MNKSIMMDPLRNDPVIAVDHAPVSGTRKLEIKQLGIILVLLAILYGILPLFLNPQKALTDADSYGGFWSPDSGARFAMIRNWIEHGSLTHVYYAYEDLDPSGQVHPLSYFLFHRPHNIASMYSPVFPLLCGVSYRAFGFVGLTLVPALCGLGCVLATYTLARRIGLRTRIPLAIVLGLATPLVIYSSLLWEHSAMMLLAVLMAYWILKAVQDNSLRDAIVAGMIIASGMWFHEQYLALFVACWVAALPLLNYRRNILIGLPIGFVSITLLWMLFNKIIYGTIAGSHLGANVFQNNNDHPFSLFTLLDLPEFANRAMAQLIGTTLPGTPYAVSPELWPYYLSLACLLIIYILWSWDIKSAVQVTISMVLALISAAMGITGLISIHRFATPAGLFEATPLLIPALAVPWYAVRRKSDPANPVSLYIAWLSRACFLFIFFLLVNPMYPGTDWGSRYLLTALPLLIVLAAYIMEQQYDVMPQRGRVVVIVTTILLVGSSLLCQVYGLLWIRRSLAYDMDLNQRLAKIDAAVVVTDADFNARLVKLPKSQARFLVRTTQDAQIFSGIIGQLNVDEIVYIGVDRRAWQLEESLQKGGYHFVRGDMKPLFPVIPANEVGDQLQVIHFAIKPIQNLPATKQDTNK